MRVRWGVPLFTSVYFVSLVMFGSFFMLNLTLAVIWAEYAKADEVMVAQVRLPVTLALNAISCL